LICHKQGLTMSSGTQVDLDWAATDLLLPDNGPLGGAGASSAPAAGKPAAKYLTDEEILGIEPSSPEQGASAVARVFRGGEPGAEGDGEAPAVNSASSDETSIRGSKDPGYSGRGDLTDAAMPGWMATAAADPRHSAEASELWREHQEFRAAFASSEEARAVKELLPGGVRDVLSLREATQSVERIDAALFSGDARAQAEVVAELARANPAAFRSLFAEAAKVVAGLGGKEAGGREMRSLDGPNPNGVAAGTQNADARKDARGDDGRSRGDGDRDEHRHGRGNGHPHGSAPPPSQGASDPPPGDPPDMSGGSVVAAPTFDPAAYAQFERATNDAVARDVRGSIHETLSRVMPEGVAEGAARRIGEDIFHEVHRALAADRTLSEQVASVLRSRRFGEAERQHVASLLARRAKQLVPSVARRVIGEWTSTVLSTARSKAARQATAASRVDIAAPGGSLDSMPLRPLAQREVNYASMSDEEILGM
jgi:hypothetical protein